MVFIVCYKSISIWVYQKKTVAQYFRVFIEISNFENKILLAIVHFQSSQTNAIKRINFDLYALTVCFDLKNDCYTYDMDIQTLAFSTSKYDDKILWRDSGQTGPQQTKEETC